MLYNYNFILTALLKEFPTDDVCPQAVSRSEIFGTPSPIGNSHAVIFAGAHVSTKDAISHSINSGHNVLFLSTSHIDTEFTRSLPNFSRPKLHIQDATRSCSQRILKDVFKQYDISVIHVIFSEYDFHKHKTSTETGKLLECLIKFLNVLSKQSKAALHLHLPVSTQLNSCEENMWQNPSQEQLHQLMDDLCCKVKFNYKYNTDNFLKAVQIYITTFKRLYNLSLTTILS